MKPDLYRAVVRQPPDRLEQLLGIVERRLEHYRAKALALAALKGTDGTVWRLTPTVSSKWEKLPDIPDD